MAVPSRRGAGNEPLDRLARGKSAPADNNGFQASAADAALIPPPKGRKMGRAGDDAARFGQGDQVFLREIENHFVASQAECVSDIASIKNKMIT